MENELKADNGGDDDDDDDESDDEDFVPVEEDDDSEEDADVVYDDEIHEVTGGPNAPTKRGTGHAKMGRKASVSSGIKRGAEPQGRARRAPRKKSKRTDVVY